MTKEELKQIHHLNNEIRMWKKELETVQCKSLALGQQFTGMPEGTKRNKDNVGEIACNITEIKNIIQNKVEELEKETKLVLEYINKIDDSLLRQIVYLRCILGMSWKQISLEVGGNNTTDSVRKIFSRKVK